jgi:acid phosphatase type 7
VNLSINISLIAILQLLAIQTLADEPLRPNILVANSSEPLTFIAYGDTRFTQRDGVANAVARRALVARIARENPAAIFIGGDLVYDGSNREDYETYKTETAEWSQAKIPIFPALGNHEFRGCDKDWSPCLENWWSGAAPIAVHSLRWYSVTLGPKVMVLVLDSDSSLKSGSGQRTWFEQQIAQAGCQMEFVFIVLHYPPVRDPIFPTVRDEKEIARYLSKHARSLHARVVVVGSHIHNYERFRRDDVTYLVSGGGGAKPVPVLRLFDELSRLETAANFHYIRFRLESGNFQGTVVRFDPNHPAETAWTEPDRFEVKAKVNPPPCKNGELQQTVADGDDQ